MLREPQCVDCNTDVIAVSEYRCSISVLSWVDGTLLAQFGSEPTQMPRGIRLLADGSGLAVTDRVCSQLHVFSLSGELLRTCSWKSWASDGLESFFDVVECLFDEGSGFVLANRDSHELVKLSRDECGTFTRALSFGGCDGSGRSDFIHPVALSVLPGGGLLVREAVNDSLGMSKGGRLQVFGVA